MATAGYDQECTICLGYFQNPKILPCFHSFCLMCLEKHINQDLVPASRYRQAYFTCPLCRKDTPLPQGGVESFQTNFYIAASQEKGNEESSVSKAVQDACDKLETIDLQLGPDKWPRSVEVQHTVNVLANMRFLATKYCSGVSRLHCDANEYATKLMSSAYEVRKEIEKARQKAVDLVQAACNETLGKLDEMVKKERNRVEDYQTQLLHLIDKAQGFDCEAVDGQLTGISGGSVTTILENLTGDCKKMMDMFPSAFDEKKSLMLVRPLASDAFWQNATAQSICGQVVFQKEQDRISEATSCNGQCSADPEHPHKSSHDSTMSNSPKLCCTLEDSRDSCSSSEADDLPLLESGSEENENIQRAVGGIQEPRLVFLLDALQAFDVVHIAPHTMDQQAWISHGQKDRRVYLFDTQGHHIRTVNTGGDAHDITVMSDNTVAVAYPSQKMFKQLHIAHNFDDVGNSDKVPSNQIFRVPFPATCVAYSSSQNIFAIAGRNNLMISMATGQTQPVVNGQTGGSDILLRPCSLAFSHMIGRMALAAADPGTHMVYIFVESSDQRTKFSRDNMFIYMGEGLWTHSLNRQRIFTPISVSGRQNLLAVLDKTSNSIALLGPSFSPIGVVSLESLGFLSPCCLAFTNSAENCWQMWLGATGGRIAVVDLPQVQGYCG